MFEALYGFFVDFRPSINAILELFEDFYDWFLPERYSYFAPLVFGCISAMIVLGIKRIII